MLHKAATRAARSSELDIIVGQAGLIVAALAVHRSTNDATLIRRLRPLAQKLRQLAISSRKRARVFAPHEGRCRLGARPGGYRFCAIALGRRDR